MLAAFPLGKVCGKIGYGRPRVSIGHRASGENNIALNGPHRNGAKKHTNAEMMKEYLSEKCPNIIDFLGSA